jgi:hypothetical protein
MTPLQNGQNQPARAYFLLANQIEEFVGNL